VVGLLVEMVLFRTFARTGIYLLKEGTPDWVYQAYSQAVWVGSVSFNLSAIVVILVLTVASGYLWYRREVVGRVLPILAASMVPWNLALFVGTPGSVTTLLYVIASAAIVVAAIAAARSSASRGELAALSIIGLSYLCVYYFEAIAPIRLAGLTFNDHALGVFQIGEALAGVGILAAFLVWGRTRRVKLLVGPVILGLLLMGGYASGPERYPLVSTWALGVTMSLPFFVYVVGLVLLGVTVLKLVTTNKVLLGMALVLLFFGHRMLPLTYFNILVMAGFLLALTALISTRSPHGGPRPSQAS
jgi:hypothetical protein